MSEEVRAPHIAIVDDDTEIQKQLSIFFKAKSFRVTAFSDAASALNACPSEGSSWNVLVSDLHLTGISGAEFTTNVLALNPELPVIFIANPRSAETAAQMIDLGAYDFLENPVDLSQLLVSVNRALRLKSLNSEAMSKRDRLKVSKRISDGIIGQSPKFMETMKMARKVAPSHANIFVTGESGVGKDVVARFIHNESHCSKGPFIAINCSSIPEALLESELFGHTKGSFTGAIEKKIGLFEEAQDGTLFLDEIGDLGCGLQSKLLRVLQDRKIRRVGDNQDREINARIISATHKDLKHEIQHGRFREDLFYRLGVIPLWVPPLRERPEDIIPLAEFFLKKFSRENQSPARYFSKEAIEFCQNNPWRGNVRELENSVERAVVLATEAEVSVKEFGDSILDCASHQQVIAKIKEKMAENDAEQVDLSKERHDFSFSFADRLPSLQDVTQKYIEYAVAFNGGAKDRTAKDLGIDRKTLYKRLQ